MCVCVCPDFHSIVFGTKGLIGNNLNQKGIRFHFFSVEFIFRSFQYKASSAWNNPPVFFLRSLKRTFKKPAMIEQNSKNSAQRTQTKQKLCLVPSAVDITYHKKQPMECIYTFSYSYIRKKSNNYIRFEVKINIAKHRREGQGKERCTDLSELEQHIIGNTTLQVNPQLSIMWILNLSLTGPIGTGHARAGSDNIFWVIFGLRSHSVRDTHIVWCGCISWAPLSLVSAQK